MQSNLRRDLQIVGDGNQQHLARSSGQIHHFGQLSAVYINFDNPELKENILTGLCIDIDIKTNLMACCIVCKRSLQTEASDDEMSTCNNNYCNIK